MPQHSWKEEAVRWEVPIRWQLGTQEMLGRFMQSLQAYREAGAC